MAKILTRYKGHPKVQITGKLLPVYSNQKTNFYLKEIAKELKIKKHLTLHIARHTFATTVTLTNVSHRNRLKTSRSYQDSDYTNLRQGVFDKKISGDMGGLRRTLEVIKGDIRKVNSK